MVARGSFYSGFYGLNNSKEVAQRIYIKDKNLPNFTGITSEDKSKINIARYNLYSLLIPIHNREKAIKEFFDVCGDWSQLSNYVYSWCKKSKFEEEF